MAAVQIYVATRDGQAERIARHVGLRLTSHGIDARVIVLPRPPQRLSPGTDTSMNVLVAAVRYGRHLAEASAFLADYMKVASRPPLALASVNLTARKPDRQSPSNNAYLRKLIARHQLAPVVARAFAGRLDYPRYRWFDRQIIRLIMAMTGGPTDGVSTVEYTQWDQVDAFADEIVDVIRRA